MSSIFGAWQINQQAVPRDTINRIIQETAWWKPDRLGHYHQKELFLGHQLLATKPNQQNEVQPFKDASAEYFIVADTRLDNRADLIKRLGLKNKATPDYELILAAYKRYKTACVQHFIGAFAFAIWDEKEQLLFCARDHIGIKPFNYYYKNHLFAFGTQKKSILAHNKVVKTPNWVNIFQRILWQEQPPNSTEYEHIQLLAPAHYIIVRRDGIQLRRYWELDVHQTISYQKEEEYVEHFRHLFQQAIRDRLISNQAAGTHLSGGLDSSGITCVADAISKEKGQTLPVFGYSVPRSFQAEPAKMEQLEENLLVFEVVDHCQLEQFYNVTHLIDRPFRQVVEEEALACDGFAQSNNVNTEYELQAAAQAKGVNVLLSGFPGDELVTSFSRPFYLEYLERRQLFAYFFSAKKSRHTFKDKLVALGGVTLKNQFPKGAEYLRRRYIRFRDRKVLYIVDNGFINKDYFSSHPDLKNALERPIFRSSYATSLKESQRQHVCRSHTSRRMEGETLAGLRFKVEYRYPMADIRLLQYVLSVPMEQKITATTTRYLFRQGMEGFLPDSIRLRDMKYRGSLKPADWVHPRTLKDKTANALWNSIQQADAAPFLHKTAIDQWLESPYTSYGIYPWLLLGHLGTKKKLQFH